jgi:hypothetical protein
LTARLDRGGRHDGANATRSTGRSEPALDGGQRPRPGNFTLGKCTGCNRNVQSVDAHIAGSGGYVHVDCAAAARRMDRSSAKAPAREPANDLAER